LCIYIWNIFSFSGRKTVEKSGDSSEEKRKKKKKNIILCLRLSGLAVLFLQVSKQFDSQGKVKVKVGKVGSMDKVVMEGKEGSGVPLKRVFLSFDKGMLCLQLRWWGWLSGLLLLSGLPVSGDSIGDFPLIILFYFLCVVVGLCSLD